MKIAKMTLKKYRNYDNLEVSFNDNLNIIIGDNAQGKTNLLESIYVLGVGLGKHCRTRCLQVA